MLDMSAITLLLYWARKIVPLFLCVYWRFHSSQNEMENQPIRGPYSCAHAAVAFRTRPSRTASAQRVTRRHIKDVNVTLSIDEWICEWMQWTCDCCITASPVRLISGGRCPVPWFARTRAPSCPNNCAHRYKTAGYYNPCLHFEIICSWLINS